MQNDETQIRNHVISSIDTNNLYVTFYRKKIKNLKVKMVSQTSFLS